METNPETLGRLHSASAAADRGARLTQQLLAFARRQPLAPQPTSVARLATDMGELLRHALGERVELEFVVADDAWNARIDPGQLENAILNLALNARDAMPDGGTVRIEVSNATLDRRYAALHPEVTPGAYVLIAVDRYRHGHAGRTWSPRPSIRSSRPSSRVAERGWASAWSTASCASPTAISASTARSARAPA